MYFKAVLLGLTLLSVENACGGLKLPAGGVLGGLEGALSNHVPGNGAEKPTLENALQGLGNAFNNSLTQPPIENALQGLGNPLNNSLPEPTLENALQGLGNALNNSLPDIDQAVEGLKLPTVGNFSDLQKELENIAGKPLEDLAKPFCDLATNGKLLGPLLKGLSNAFDPKCLQKALKALLLLADLFRLFIAAAGALVDPVRGFSDVLLAGGRLLGDFVVLLKQ